MNPIAARMLRVGIPLGLFTVGVCVFFQLLVERSEKRTLQSRQDAGLDLATNAFMSDIASVDSDLAILSTLEDVAPALDPAGAAARARLARAFRTVVRVKRVYEQVRLLGPTGRELVRVNYREGRASIVPDVELRDESDRPYFREALAREPGTVYVSPIDLNEERGVVSEPLTPTLRLATSVADGGSGARGVVVINYLVREALDGLKRAIVWNVGGVVLVDEAGFFLRGRAPEEEWGSQLPGRGASRFGVAFPEAWKTVKSDERGSVHTARGRFAFRTVLPSSFLRRPGGGSGHWKIVSVISPPEFQAVERRYLWVVAMAGGTLLVLMGFVLYFGAERRARAEAARRRAAEALRASEQRTRAILENMLGGLIMVDPQGLIELVNPAGERMFGYSGAELLGQPLRMLVPATSGIDAGAFLRKAAEKAMGRVTEWEGRRKNGDIFPFELALFQFETPEGRRIAGSFVDITERHGVDRLKREFMSSISHELRTPLTSIRGSLGLLAGGALGKLPEEAVEFVAVAERNAVRLIGLINDILDLERLEGGRLEMEFESVETSPIVARALEAVQSLADQAGILLAAEPASVRVRADGDRIVQVLVNLLSNAVKFSPAGSAVRVRVVPGPSMAEFQVEDRGRGVPPALREAIFERYRQVEGSDSRRKGGVGLGLAICKSIVEQHGGTIGVRAAEGGGSTFWFRIPLASVARLSLSGNLKGALGLALLVDDDEELLSILELRLAQDRIATQRATTARGAIAAAQALKPDVLVLDLGLPDGDGSEVVEALRRDKTLRDLPLLVYTGRDLRQEDRDRLVLGPTRYLTKSREAEDEFRSVVLELLAEGERRSA